MGGAPRSRHLAQPSAERGAVDPRRPSVAHFPSKMLSFFFLWFRCFRAYFLRRGAYWFPSAGGRSSSTAPATSTAPLTK
jgi:hypothetical protein